jgi:hypothetical protein
LLVIEHRRPAALSTASARCRETSHRAFADEVALELGQRAEHVEDEPAATCRRVDALVQGPEADPAQLKRVHGLDQVSKRTAEPVELPHDDHVALARVGDRRVAADASRGGAAGDVGGGERRAPPGSSTDGSVNT